MMAEKENTAGARTIREEDIGTVKIADDVVAMIAGYASREVDGVAEMAGVGYTSQPLFGRQQRNRNNRNRGVRVDVSESGVRVDLDVVLSYGYNIPTTSAKIQQRVKQAIENMTGLKVLDVNVRIAGIDMPQGTDKSKE
ncbi:MAG TPA: Asp23/Gls24 family envelope stress response protein [Lachnospiraceae bacterium]|nr:Asp23/Gls24 family envelope stress response protein [Lachnospiraceae bacterium]